MLKLLLQYLLDEYSFFNHFVDIAFLLLIVLLCYLFVEKYLSKFIKIDFHSSLEKFVFYEGLGLGILAYTTFFLGIFKLLYRWVFYLLLIVLILLVFDRLIETFNKIKQALLSGIKLPDFSKYELILLSIGFLYLFFYICFNLFIPSFGWDDLHYHLAVPKLYIANHQIYNFPYFMRSFWVMLYHMLYVFGLLIKGEMLTKGFQFIIVMLTGLTLYAFCRHYFPRWVAMFAFVAYISDPLIYGQSCTANIETSLAFFELLALYAAIIWFEKQKSPWMFLSAIFCGLALASKYTGAFNYIAIMLIFFVFWVKNKNNISFTGLCENIMIFSLTVFFASFVWYLKNYIYSGNPVLPYANNIFKSPYWYQIFETANYSGFGMGKNIIDITMLLWNTSLYPMRFGSEKSIGFTLVIFLPLFIILLISKKKPMPSAIYYVFMYFLLRYTMFAVSVHYIRYFIPVIPMIILLLSYCVFELTNTLPKKHVKAFLLIIVCIIILQCPIFSPIISRSTIYQEKSSTIDVISKSINDLKNNAMFSFGAISTSQLLKAQNWLIYYEQYKIAQYINKYLPDNAKLFFVFAEFGYWHDKYYFYDLNYMPEIKTQIRRSFKNEFYSGIWQNDFYSLLKNNKFTHILIDFQMPGIEFTDYKKSDFLNFKAKYLKLIHAVGDTELYEIR